MNYGYLYTAELEQILDWELRDNTAIDNFKLWMELN